MNTAKPASAFSTVGNQTLRHHSAHQAHVSADVTSFRDGIRMFGIIVAGVVEIGTETSEDHARAVAARLSANGWTVALEQTEPDKGWGAQYRVSAKHPVAC
jgi:hypothetical protein